MVLVVSVCLFLKTAKHWSEMYVCVGERIQAVERELLREMFGWLFVALTTDFGTVSMAVIVVVIVMNVVSGGGQNDGYICCCHSTRNICYLYGSFCRQHIRESWCFLLRFMKFFARYKNIHTFTSRDTYEMRISTLCTLSKLCFFLLLVFRNTHQICKHHDKSERFYPILSVTGTKTTNDRWSFLWNSFDHKRFSSHRGLFTTKATRTPSEYE